MHHLFGQAQGQTGLPNLIFEQVSQGLYQLKSHGGRKPAHVVMRLYLCRGSVFVRLAFYNVRIEGSLGKELHLAQSFSGDIFKNVYELFAYDVALSFRVGYAGKLAEEALLRVYGRFRLRPRFLSNTFRTRSGSSRRMSPLLTKIQVSWLPTAL